MTGQFGVGDELVDGLPGEQLIRQARAPAVNRDWNSEPSISMEVVEQGKGEDGIRRSAIGLRPRNVLCVPVHI